MVYKSSQEARFATTVAIDKDRNSQHAVKWTLDNLPPEFEKSFLSMSIPNCKTVIDGERANEYRRKLLPTYKAHRKKLLGSTSKRFTAVERSHKLILDVLKKCNVPVVKLESHEADDIVATLVGQVLQKGFLVVIASPDKDFKQLISEDAQIVVLVPNLNRWSFYTLKHYRAQYNCDPQSDLSLSASKGGGSDLP
nr:uncharacterized protein LOC109175770 [Ipomoea trifida]